jgi:hypothetical protein
MRRVVGRDGKIWSIAEVQFDIMGIVRCQSIHVLF